MGMLGVGILPLGMPESFWIAINRIGAFAVLAGGFFAIHANNLQRGFRRFAGFLHHSDLRCRGPRLAVNFRERLEFDEPALSGFKGNGLLVFVFAQRALLDGFAKVIALNADIKLVVLDRAMV